MTPFYGNADDARKYWSDRGYVIPVAAADDDTVNQWLLVASTFLDNTYRTAFSGWKVGLRPQVREWPRSGATDTDGYYIDDKSIPQEMLDATYEVALREGRNPGSLAVDFQPGKYESVRIEGAINVKYNSTLTAMDVQTQFLIVSQILGSILTGDGGDAASGLSGGACRV